MKSIFQNHYNRENFTQIIRTVFSNSYQALTTPEKITDIDGSIAISALWLGKITLADGNEIAVYETTLTPNCNLSRNRVGVRNLLRNYWKYYDGAFIVSHKPNDDEWRFSFLSETKGLDENGNYSTQRTQAKRFTYLFGKEHPCRTAVERFTALQSSEKTLKSIIDAFSVEALSKDFYKKLFNWYEWAMESTTNITFPDTLNPSAKDAENMSVKIIRMITRILFVWFIKQKKLVTDDLFDIHKLKNILVDFNPQASDNGNYYNAILQNLFFATLNRAVIDDEGNPRRFTTLKNKRDVRTLYRYQEMFSISENEVIELFNKIPFLNGGLFECLDKFKSTDLQQDTDVYFDGFSRNDARNSNGNFKYRAFVPNMLFFNKDENKDEKQLGLFQLLQQYNFTIEENITDDVQVSLDPELLGRVFENLLAAYNPETQESARKSTGSFYTPREIVNYMVDESLIEHLQQQNPELDIEKIRYIFENHKKPDNFTKEQSFDVIAAIKSIKILDPACGSGAFPMGCLLRMVEIIELLQGHSENRYESKLHIIENCIFGIDIQPIAMLISKLRFFISLICEQNNVNFDSPETNYEINTLPNLETKFVAANTLLSADIRNFDNDWTNDTNLVGLKNELLNIRHEHFRARSSYKKQRIKNDDEKKREEILHYILQNASKPDEEKINQWREQVEKKQSEIQKYKEEKWIEEWTTPQGSLFETPQPTLFKRDINKEKRDELTKEIQTLQTEIKKEENKSILHGFEAAVEQVTQWNPYDQNETSPFFDAEWMFGVKDGFDIVIGNPPYFSLSTNSNIKDNNGKSLKHNKLYEKCLYKTFENSGDIYCLFYERGWQLLKKSGHLCYITSNKWMRAGYGEATRKFFAENTNPIQLIDFAGIKVFESATVDTNILLFAKQNNTLKTQACVVKDKELKNLSDYFRQNVTISAFSGGESWVILSEIEQRIKAKIEAVGTPLKDWDIQINYGIKTGFNEAFIIDDKKRQELIEQDPKSDEIIRPILRGRDIKRYGYENSKLYLINTHNGIKEKGVKPIDINDYPAVKQHLDNYYPQLEKRQDKGDTPYNLRNCAYIEDFSKQKIIYPNMTKYMPFYLDKKGYYTNQKCFILTGHNLAYLVTFFNSKIFKICYRDNFPELQGGTRELSKIFFEKIKIPQISDLISEDFETFVENMQNGEEYADKRLERALLLALDLYEYEDFITNYEI